MVYQLTIIQILCSILLYVEDEVLFVQPSINKASNIRQNEYFVRIGFLITLVLFNQKELLSLQIRIVDLIFATLLLNCLKVVKYFFNVFKHTHTLTILRRMVENFFLHFRLFPLFIIKFFALRIFCFAKLFPFCSVQKTVFLQSQRERVQLRKLRYYSVMRHNNHLFLEIISDL